MTDEEQEGVFEELVRATWAKHEEAFRNQRIDDVLLGAVVASTVKIGYSLIGLNSDGVNHHLRFENLANQARVLFRLTHLSEDLAVAKVQGHLGSVVVGFGERVDRVALASLQNESASLFAPGEPGIVTFAADPASGYLYAQMSLLLDLDRYIRDGFRVDLDGLQAHVGSVVHSLQKVLRGRLAKSTVKRVDAGSAFTLRTAAHRRELEESRDEILIGEVIAVMADAGSPVVGVSSDVDFQHVRFLAPDDAVLYSFVVAVDRIHMTRTVATLVVRGEVRLRAARPAQILAAHDQAQALAAAGSGDAIEVGDDGSSLWASTSRKVAIDRLLDPAAGRDQIRDTLHDAITRLRAKLANVSAPLDAAPVRV